MESRRWLFPFTHGVDMRAIDTVVRLAGDEGVTLVAISLIAVPPERWSQGARLEHIQQSKDFLEAVKWKAIRMEALLRLAAEAASRRNNGSAYNRLLRLSTDIDIHLLPRDSDE